MPKRKCQKSTRFAESKRRRVRVISSDSSEMDENTDPRSNIPDDELEEVNDILTTSQAPCATTQTQITPFIEKDPELPELPELPPDILSALGDSTDDIPDFGEEIHSNLAERWTPILRKGLDSDVKAKLLAEYKIPSNCTLLKSPTINPEIAVAITGALKARDKKLETAQQQLGLGISALNKAMTLLFTGNDKIQAIKILSDSCRILSDLHHVRTDHRVSLLTPSLDKSFLDIIEGKERDETLFGKDLSDKIKTAKAIEKQGLQIKKSVLTTTQTMSSASSSRRIQGNWSGPPHFPSNRRGGRGGYRTIPTAAHQYTQRRPPPPPPPPSAATAAASRYRRATSPGNKQRAPRRR